MEQIKKAIRQRIDASDIELNAFLQGCSQKTYKRNQWVSQPDSVPHDIFFINKGIIRVLITDNAGNEHTIHFALENEFIADYSSFIQQKPARYSLQALEETTTVVLPRKSIEWGYANLKEGQKLGRLIAEQYFIYQDERIKDLYLRSPKQRYDHIAEVFPDIHNRVPQRMIASYLGITPIHLSRLKKKDL